MINLFRKTRNQLVSKGKFSKYLAYAFGEVILVVIGILIALSINNWNENRKITKNVSDILITISNDLATDTIYANNVIAFYEENQKISSRIINKELNRTNYKECPTCSSIVTIYRPLTIQTKGWEMLKKINATPNNRNDSLISDISQVYTIFTERLQKSNSHIESEVLNNLESFKKYPWFVDWTQAIYNKEMIIYFTEGEEFRKKVASHNILASNNHLPLVKLYRANAIEIIKRIKQRINSK